MKKITLKAAIMLLITVLVLIVYEGYELFQDRKPVDGDIFVHFLDVGQAECILIQSDKGNVVIDGGERDNEAFVIDYIKNAGVHTIDYVIATHPHSDHIGGLDGIIRAFDVKNVIMPDAVHTTVTFEQLLDAIEYKRITPVTPKVGDVFDVGEMEFLVVAPNSETYDNLNNYSIGLIMRYGDAAFLFTGDAEALAEAEIIANGLDITASVYSAGHHGSVTSSTGALLDRVNPDVCVISCGRNNTYGHPHRETLSELQKRGIEILRTDVLGTIVIGTDGSELIITTSEGI